MASLWSYLLAANYIAAALVVGAILRRPRDPAAMLSWVLAVLVLPGIGMLLYWLFGEYRIRRKATRRRRRVAHLISRIDDIAPLPLGHPDALPPDLARVERLAERMCQMPAIGNNHVEVYADSQATYAALETAILQARDHIHLQYYIWQPDETGRHFRDLLVKRAREGVEVRLLLDSVGSWKLRRAFLQPLSAAGAQVSFFMPFLPTGRKRWSLHLRNHRKIVVVDGRIGFTGSHNIGDQYRSRLKRLSPWVDSHMQIRGPAVLMLAHTFAEDWSFATQQALIADRYYPVGGAEGESVVQILPTGPDRFANALGQVLFSMVSSASHTLRIETPYFVPDPSLQAALMHAAYHGVRVQLVIPSRTDAPLVLWAGRSYYGELVDAGVEIYEYDAAVLHSKIISVDDRWCMLGSANMDVRSFRLNFEITALVYDRAVASQMSVWINRHAERARRITPRLLAERSFARSLMEGAARLFAPLL